jgi:very-short-patch-repair endonuclease
VIISTIHFLNIWVIEACIKGHVFKQKVSNHLQGKGCNICRESLGERIISIFLENNNIKYTRQKKFKECKYLSLLPFDFYLDDFNILIEYDGIQHFEPVSVFGGKEEFEKTKIRDKIKNEYCFKNNIRLFRISYLDDINIELSRINELIIL